MKKALVSMSMVTLLAASSIPAQAQENLIYVPVNPCRIVDTRVSSGGTGPIAADSSRNFLVSGTVTSQGGTTAGCTAPRPNSEPLAISAYVVAVPDSGSTGGALAAYPSDQTAPPTGEGATVNFAAGQTIGNTTNITLCEPGSCPTTGDTGEFAVLARRTSQHVVVDVQGYFYPAAGTCPDDMVAAGSLCIDKYEASVWDAATGGNQLSPAGPGGGVPNIVCSPDGSDCGANATNPIYARSEAGFLPAGHISWYQAVQACANVGKRLPTTAEWQAGALGTPPGDGGGCNIAPGGTTPSLSGANDATCASPAGAFDMIGNVWEMTAELDLPTTAAASSIISSNTMLGRSVGDDFSSSGNATTTATFIVAPNTTNGKVGFRCVR